ncbi:MAG: TetR/AcrR family transcriptional regulator [Clostridia bacterium]|nr:TetR/AcrR family transcriptional regulator [Clostridia bacterium]
MQIDKRILKTRNHLKNTLISMLDTCPFEKITVKAICDRSNTSRITFYTHYHDKYELVDDLSEDMLAAAQKEYIKLQEKNNKNHNPITSYCNFLECILNMYYQNFKFFSHTSPTENPYLNFYFYKYILKYLEIHAKKRSSSLKPKYSPKKIAGFLCYGLWGFIAEGLAEKCPIEQIKSEAITILKGILQFEILTNNN